MLMAEPDVGGLRFGTYQFGISHDLAPGISLSLFGSVTYEFTALEITIIANANYSFALLNHCLRNLHAGHL